MKDPGLILSHHREDRVRDSMASGGGDAARGCARTRGILRQPNPLVLQESLGYFTVVYEINAYVDKPRAMVRLYSALHCSILDVFNEYGVQIMTPAYEGDPVQPKVVPQGQWFAAPARSGEPSKTDGKFGRSLAGLKPQLPQSPVTSDRFGCARHLVSSQIGYQVCRDAGC